MGAYKAAGRPLPKFSEDDVLDFMVTEAVVAKYYHDQKTAQEKAEEEQKRRAWAADTSSLAERVGAIQAGQNLT